jgi:hypothetical protein
MRFPLLKISIYTVVSGYKLIRNRGASVYIPLNCSHNSMSLAYYSDFMEVFTISTGLSGPKRQDPCSGFIVFREASRKGGALW